MKKFLFMLFIASFMLTSCNKSAKLNSGVDKIESTHDHDHDHDQLAITEAQGDLLDSATASDIIDIAPISATEENS